MTGTQFLWLIGLWVLAIPVWYGICHNDGTVKLRFPDVLFLIAMTVITLTAIH